MYYIPYFSVASCGFYFLFFLKIVFITWPENAVIANQTSKRRKDHCLFHQFGRFVQIKLKLLEWGVPGSGAGFSPALLHRLWSPSTQLSSGSVVSAAGSQGSEGGNWRGWAGCFSWAGLVESLWHKFHVCNVGCLIINHIG